MAKLKRGDREYNQDTNEWNVKKKKDKPTPASNTRKKMKSEAPKASAPKKSAPAKKKAPIPKDRPKKAPVKGLRIPKGPQKERQGVATKSALAVNSDGAGVTRSTKAGNLTRNWGANESVILESSKSKKKKK